MDRTSKQAPQIVMIGFMLVFLAIPLVGVVNAGTWEERVPIFIFMAVSVVIFTIALLSGSKGRRMARILSKVEPESHPISGGAIMKQVGNVRFVYRQDHRLTEVDEFSGIKRKRNVIVLQAPDFADHVKETVIPMSGYDVAEQVQAAQDKMLYTLKNKGLYKDDLQK